MNTDPRSDRSNLVVSRRDGGCHYCGDPIAVGAQIDLRQSSDGRWHPRCLGCVRRGYLVLRAAPEKGSPQEAYERAQREAASLQVTPPPAPDSASLLRSTERVAPNITRSVEAACPHCGAVAVVRVALDKA